jgi:hypothetical protein
MTATFNWRLDFMREHARLFNLIVDEPERSVGYPNCQEGWRDVLERLCARIEAALREGETFEFVRIQQKFGPVRIAWDGEVSLETRARIEAAVSLAEARSGCICELCGAEGAKYHAAKVITVRCQAHAGRPVTATRGSERLHLVRMMDSREVRVSAVRRYDRETDTFIGPPVDADATLPRRDTEPEED